jgi:sugar phosphate isomerase/epimerase
MSITRRSFIGGGAAAAALFAGGISHAAPLGLPLGLQLYSVRALLPKDYLGTLQQVAALGYKEVEAAGFYDHSADEVNAAMKTAGLRCVSSHYGLPVLRAQLDTILPFAKTLGLDYIVCSSPMHQQEGAKGPLTLDDWRWSAGQFNEIAAKVEQAGMRFAYHNHFTEFTPIDGVLPYDELLEHTDPAKVSFEMDCGWVIVGGQSPVEYMQHHGSRIVMLHVKDFKNNKPPSVPLGTGSIDYAPIFAAARHAKIRHIFVEQEEFKGPIMDELKIDARYMQATHA